MKIEVLHIDDCPNWEATGVRVKEALSELGDASTAVDFRLLSTPDEAARTPFAGSPTISLNGEDLFPSEGRTSELACRIYFTPDGLAGLPTVQQLIEAIGHHEHWDNCGRRDQF
jgi:hypothetical protein